MQCKKKHNKTKQNNNTHFYGQALDINCSGERPGLMMVMAVVLVMVMRVMMMLLMMVRRFPQNYI